MNYENNVLVSLSASVGLNDTSITFLDATAPLNNPPTGPGIMTLADNYNLPTKLEIFSYAGVTDNGNGSFTLTGCTRGLEGTTNQQWQVGHVGYMSFTAGRINDFSTQTLTSAGDTNVGGDLNAEGAIRLRHGQYLTGESAGGTPYTLARIGTGNIAELGTTAFQTRVHSSVVPEWNNGTVSRDLLHVGGGQAVAGDLEAATFTEGGTLLSAKYLGINATADNALLLEGSNKAYYRNAGNMNAGVLPAARLSGDYAINAATATALETSRTISLTGDVTGSASFNGTANASIAATVGNDSHTHGASTITGVLNTGQIPDLSATYLPKSGGAMSGALNLAGNDLQQVNIAAFNNIEGTALTADGQVGFDSSQGLMVFRTQQGTSGATSTILDGSNVDAGTGINITNLASGTTGSDTGTSPFTFSFDTTWGDARYLGKTANAVSASKLATARSIALSGDVTGSANFDGTGNITISAVVANDSHTHGTQYLGLTAKAADSNLLDGINSSSFLRSDAADIKTSGYLRFNDGITCTFGSSDDAEFFHNGSHMYTDINTGDWYVRQGTTTRYLFDVSAGNFHADGHVYWQSGSVGSDPELKKNARVIDSPIKRLKKLNGYFFEWIDGKPGLTGGLMSPEIRKALPGTVHKTGGVSEGRKKYDQFDYNCATGLLVEVTKNHEDRIVELAYQLAELRAELEAL